MSEFKLIEDKFSEEYNENWWTYAIEFDFIFNKRTINYITITDYIWKKKKGREMITKELIWEILAKRINGGMLIPEPKKNPVWKRDTILFPREFNLVGKVIN